MHSRKASVLLLLLPFLIACVDQGGDLSSSSSFPSSVSFSSSLDSDSSSAFDSSEGSSSDQSSEASSSLSESSSLEQFQEKTFSHVFKKADFPDSSKGGTAFINGIDFAYTPITFLGQNAEGMQIGSNSRPQKNPFVLSFSCPDGVKLCSYSFYAKGSGFSGSVSCGELSNPFSERSSALVEVSFDGLLNDSFALSIHSDGSYAFYLYSLSLTFLVPAVSSFSPSSDEGNAKALVQGQGNVPAANFAPLQKDAYYQGMDLTLTGQALRTELVEKSSSKTLQRYGDAKTMLPYIDENPTKPGYMVGFYDGDDLSASWDGCWNREHVWACAHLRIEGKDVDVRPGESKRGIGTDLHNLHPSCTTSNGYHSDKMFGQNQEGRFYPNVNLGFPHKGQGDFRGDVARTVFYMYATYPDLRLVDDYTELSYLEMGSLKDLLEWNKLDPVDEYESRRNDRVFSYQGNRNPFIDYPTLAEALFA